MLRRPPLALRGLWWRRGVCAALLAVGVITSAAAALGPLYARATHESTLIDRLRATPSGTALAFDGFAPARSATVPVQDAPKPGDVRGFPTRIVGYQKPSSVSTSAYGMPVGSGLAWRDGFCAHVRIVQGHCARAAGELVVAERASRGGYQWSLGASLTFADLTAEVVQSDGSAAEEPLTGHIVGTYRPLDVADPYWGGRPFFGHGVGQADKPDQVETVFTDRRTFLTAAQTVTVPLQIDFPFDIGQIDLAAVEPLIAQVKQLFDKYGEGANLVLNTHIDQVLQAAVTETATQHGATSVVSLQLAFLAWLVLFGVASDVIEARGAEIALAKVRGLSLGATLRLAVAEPLVVLLLSVPIGIGVAWAATYVLARDLMAPGTTVQLPLGVLAAGLAAFAGGAVAAGLAARRVLTRPVVDQWRRTTRSTGAGRSPIVELLVAAAALAGGVVLLTRDRGHPSTLSLLTPGLLVLAVGLIGVRLLPLVLRPAGAATRRSPHLGMFLAVRQVLRRPVGLRLAALLATTVGMATFAVVGQAVAQDNRVRRAQVEVGARQVVSVAYEPGHDPVTLTHRVDPDGRWAMAVAQWLPSGGAVSGTVLAADVPRLAAVANWDEHDAPPVRSVVAALHRDLPSPVTVRSTGLRFTVSASGLTRLTPTLTAVVDTGRALQSVAATRAVTAGTATYTLTVPCSSGCVLRGVVWDRPFGRFDAMSGTATIRSVEQVDGGGYRALDAHLNLAEAWRAGASVAGSTDRISVDSTGVHDTFTSTGGGVPSVDLIDTPASLPAVANPKAIAAGIEPTVNDINDTAVPFQVVRTSRVLPAVVDNGVLLDVTYLTRRSVDFPNEAVWSVWLGPQAPSDAVARLRSAGLPVGSVHTTAERATVLGRQGPALALSLLVACAVAGTVLAVGALALSVSAGARRRAFEFASLRVVGVRRSSLARAGVLEQGLLLGAALILGVPSGVVAAAVVVDRIPQFSDPTPVTLAFSVPAFPVIVLAGSIAVLLVLTAVLAGLLVLRAAVPSTLRTVEQ